MVRALRSAHCKTPQIEYVCDERCYIHLNEIHPFFLPVSVSTAVYVSFSTYSLTRM